MGCAACVERRSGGTRSFGWADASRCGHQLLGRAAAARLQVPWDVVITAEEAGFYKPDPRPYQLALERLGIAAGEAAFVAGSGYDLIGTAAVGLRTYWHNRVGVNRPDGAPPADHESRNLDDLVPWLEGFR